MAKAVLHIEADNIDAIKSKLDEIEKSISRIEKKVSINVDSSKVSRATQEVSKLEAAGRRVEGVFSSIGGAMQSVGGYMQSLGDAFGGKIVGTVKTMATAFGTMGLYSAAEGTVKRYDIMRMFPKQMKHIFGDTKQVAEDATEIVNYLEQAVLGLPTGLDEIVQSAQQFIMLTGDMKRGADIAIAANNAFLASGANAKQVYFAQEQLRDLLSAGELGETEWRSLLKGLGASLGPIAEKLGYSGQVAEKLTDNADKLARYESQAQKIRNKLDLWRTEGGHKESDIKKNEAQLANLQKTINKLSKGSQKDLGAFRQALKKNKISADEFLDAMVAAGTDGGEIQKRAWEYKATLSATAANIKNAIQRLGEAGLSALDEALLGETGQDLPNTIINVSEAIKKKLTPALKDWLATHHEEVGDFVKNLMSYDWVGLVSKIAGGLAKYYKLMAGFFTKINPSIIAFLSVWAGPVGRMLSAGGGIVKGIGGFFGRVLGWLGRLGGGEGKAVEEGAKTLTRTAGSLGTFGMSLKSAFAGLGLAAGGVALIAEIGAVIAEYVKIGEMIGKADFGNFDKNVGKVGLFIAEVSGIASALVAGGFLVGKSKTASLAVGIGELLAGGFVAILAGIGGVIAEYVNIADKIATMKPPSDNQISRLGDVIVSLNTDVLGKVKKIPTSKVNSLQKLADSMEYIADIGESLQAVKKVGNVGNVGNRLKNILESTKSITDFNFTNEDKKKAKAAAKTLEHLSSSMDSVKAIASSMADMRATMKQLIKRGDATNLNNLTSGIRTLLQKVDDSLYDMRFLTKERQAQMQNVERIKNSVDNIGIMVDTLYAARKKIKNFIKVDKDGTQSFPTGERIGAILGSLLSAFDDTNLDLKTREREVQMQNIERLSKSVEGVGKIADTLQSARKTLASLMPTYGANGAFDQVTNAIKSGKMKKTPMQALAGRIKQLVSDLKGLSEAISEEDIDLSGDAQAKMTALSDSIKSLPDIIGVLKEIRTPLSRLGIDGEKWGMGDNLKTMVNGLSEAFKDTAGEDFSGLGENATNMLTAVDNVRQMVNKLVKIKSIIEEQFTFTDGSWDLGVKLGQVFGGLTSAFNLVGPSLGGNGGAGSLASVGPALDAIGQALGLIASNASNASSNLDKAKSSLSHFGKTAANRKEDIANVAAQTARLKSALDGIFGKGMTAAMGVNALGSSAQNQYGNISAAASAASRLAAAIASIPSQKTVNISVRGAGSTGSGDIIVPGGRITEYASGGTVHGPGGIDNVPAWLTSGEYVMTKRAHSAFGSSFMNRVNNLDVDGAMRALSLRVGSGIRNRATVTNNYNRDNHANVTFNVNRATQGFTQRRASRWARALS